MTDHRLGLQLLFPYSQKLAMKTDYQPKSKWSIDDIDAPNAPQYQQKNKPRKIGRWILIILIIIVIILSITWLANTSTHPTNSKIHKQTQEQHNNMVSIPLTLPKKAHPNP